MKNRKFIWVGVVVVLGVVLTFWLVGQRRTATTTKPTQEGRYTPSSAPAEKPDIKDTQAAIENSRTLIDLRDVSGQGRSGSATRSSDGTTFLLTISAQLPGPEAGRYYEGWLLSSRETPAELSVGRLFQADPGVYALVFSSERSLYGYERVTVTLEVAEDGKPETYILEGSF
jgi:hypothetical protein